ncbi:MAG: hypothetical protein RI907_55 [Pseudomonadota bacterium]|jgi:S-adenosylmethionine decarboxylase proenzyme
MQGLHFTADLSGCDAHHPWMQDTEALAAHCLALVARHGLHTVGQLFHRFTPRDGCDQAGVTGMVLLAESHLAVHTWPELGRVTLDLFVCNQRANHSTSAQRLMDSLVTGFAPEMATRQTLLRGWDGPPAGALPGTLPGA